MNIRLTLQKIRPSRLLQKYVHQRVQNALTRVEAHVRAVTVLLGDRNGRRGGGDKFCRIQLELASGGRVKIQDTHASAFRAVDRAAGRLQSPVQRMLRHSAPIL